MCERESERERKRENEERSKKESNNHNALGIGSHQRKEKMEANNTYKRRCVLFNGYSLLSSDSAMYFDLNTVHESEMVTADLAASRIDLLAKGNPNVWVSRVRVY